MPLRTTSTTVRTLDGLKLAGTFDRPEGQPLHAALLVHGAGVTRDEGGFFTQVAAGLADAGVASLRFDLPGGDGRAPESHERRAGRTTRDAAMTAVTASAVTRVVKSRPSTEEPLLSVTVWLTSAELAALSFVAVVVTSAVDAPVVNAADRGLRKIREAAAGHPELPVWL